MRALVTLHRTQLGETPPTMPALVQLLSGVNALVFAEPPLAPERLPAVAAAVALLSGVCALVQLQSTLLVEAPPTVGALVPLLVLVGRRDDSGRQVLAADLSGAQQKDVLLGVASPDVFVEERLRGVGQRAQRAGEDHHAVPIL